MGTFAAVAAAGQTEGGPDESRASPDSQRDSLALTDGSAVAGLARAIRELEDSVQSVSPLATARDLGQDLGRGPSRGGRARQRRLDNPFRRRKRGARPPACGGSKKGADQALGRSRGGFSTKIHLRAEGFGKPITFCVTGGERHEQTAVPTLLETGAVKRPGRGRPRLRPDRVGGDKGYSSRTVRRYLRRRGIGAVIPRRTNEPPQRSFDRAAYRERNRVERLINRLKQNRAIATRYDKLAVSYHALLTFACILIWL
jgi:transposase